VFNHPATDCLKVACEVDLGHRVVIAGIGPERLSGLEINTPITTGLAVADGLAAAAALEPAAGMGTAVSSGAAGISVCTSTASLSGGAL
jgi:hypothetical protein